MKNPAIAAVGISLLLFAVAEADADVVLGEAFYLNADAYQTNPYDPGDWGPSMAGDGAGNWIAVWVRYVDEPGSGDGVQDTEIVFSASTQSGLAGTWSDPAVLHLAHCNTDGLNDQNPQVATDENGIWVVTWERDIDGEYDQILFSRTANLGVDWSSPEVLSTSPTDGVYPRIAADGAGHWMIIWWRFGMVGTGPLLETAVYFTRSMDNGQTWSSPPDDVFSAISNPLQGEWIEVDAAEVDVDGQGVWVVAWSLDDLANTSELRYRRSTDNGQSWTQSQTIPLGQDWGLIKLSGIVADGNGNWMNVTRAHYGPGGADVYSALYSRSTDCGANWTTPAAIHHDGDWDKRATIATDRLGTWTASWVSSVSGEEIRMLFYTEDLGQNWTRISLEAYPQVDRYDFYTPAIPLAGAGQEGFLFAYTTDGDLPQGGANHGSDWEILSARMGCAATVEGVYSSVTHGPAGAFRLLLDSNDIEPRIPGLSGNPNQTRLEFEVSVPMDTATVVPANVSAADSLGNPYGGTIAAFCTGGLNGADTLVVVTFTPALADEECWTIDLTGMTVGGLELCDPTATIRMLGADADRDGGVTPADGSAITGRLGWPVDAATAQYDLDTDGWITTADGSRVTQRLGNVVAACPP